jgi:hypothetical protein
MCQFDICACAPVQSGREGPRVSLIVDRRVRPAVSIAGGRREADRVLDAIVADASRREPGSGEQSGDGRAQPTFALAR